VAAEEAVAADGLPLIPVVAVVAVGHLLVPYLTLTHLLLLQLSPLERLEVLGQVVRRHRMVELVGLLRSMMEQGVLSRHLVAAVVRLLMVSKGVEVEAAAPAQLEQRQHHRQAEMVATLPSKVPLKETVLAAEEPKAAMMMPLVAMLSLAEPVEVVQGVPLLVEVLSSVPVVVAEPVMQAMLAEQAEYGVLIPLEPMAR